MPNRSSIPQTTPSIRSQVEHLHLPIHLLAATDIQETCHPVTPPSSMEASTLIAGRIANRVKTLPSLLNNTIGDQTQVPLRFSSHRMLATMHLLRPHPSTQPLARVLVAGRTAKDRSSPVRTVPTPHSHQGPLRRTPRRDRVTSHPDLHLRPISDPTIDTRLPRLQRRLLPPDQTELPRLRVLLRTMPPLRRPRPRLHDPLNLRRCLKGTTPRRRSASHETTAILVKCTTLRLVALAVVSKVASAALFPSMPSRRRRQKHRPRGRHPRLVRKRLPSPRQPGHLTTPQILPRQPSRRSLAGRCSTRS